MPSSRNWQPETTGRNGRNSPSWRSSMRSNYCPTSTRKKGGHGDRATLAAAGRPGETCEAETPHDVCRRPEGTAQSEQRLRGAWHDRSAGPGECIHLEEILRPSLADPGTRTRRTRCHHGIALVPLPSPRLRSPHLIRRDSLMRSDGAPRVTVGACH